MQRSVDVGHHSALYNVLERLRAGTAPHDLEPDDQRVFDSGLVLILKELHERLDLAVADAYGWAGDLDDETILARLVSLNRERAREEAKGIVRWLRPEYQIPRYGTVKDKSELDLVGGGLIKDPAVRIGTKPFFPADEMAQTAAVMAALAAATGPVHATSLAAGFRQGRKVASKVGAVLTALARMGFVATADGGKTFQLRRAA